MSELEITEEFVAIVKEGFSKEMADDDIIRKLFEVGVEFKSLRPVFNQIIQSEGLRLSAKERKAKIEELLTGWVPGDAETVTAKCDELAEALGVVASKAMPSIRNWAKANEIELPKQERKPTHRKAGFGGYIGTVLSHVMENKEITRKEIEEFCASSEIPAKYAALINNIVTFAREFNEDVDTEVTQETPESGTEESEAA